jgi:hypothetical protein
MELGLGLSRGIARDEHVGSWMHVVTMGHVSLRARMKG